MCVMCEQTLHSKASGHQPLSHTSFPLPRGSRLVDAPSSGQLDSNQFYGGERVKTGQPSWEEST